VNGCYFFFKTSVICTLGRFPSGARSEAANGSADSYRCLFVTKTGKTTTQSSRMGRLAKS